MKFATHISPLLNLLAQICAFVFIPPLLARVYINSKYALNLNLIYFVSAFDHFQNKHCLFVWLFVIVRATGYLKSYIWNKIIIIDLSSGREQVIWKKANQIFSSSKLCFLGVEYLSTYSETVFCKETLGKLHTLKRIA